MGTIDKHAIVDKLFKIKSRMWSTSPERPQLTEYCDS